jgi:histidine triad (HIT) family protein
MAECIFCKIVQGEAPASIVYEDDQTLAFMDLGHVNPGHTIVAVKPHIENIYGLDETLAAAAFRTATRIAQALKQAMQAAGMTLLQANEAAGWQTVFHFHFHVLPRHANDGAAITWPAKRPPREELERYAAQVRAVLESEQAPASALRPASDQERLAGKRPSAL